MNRPELPPILNTKEYKSLVEKYKQEDEKQRQYCYKPHRTLHNYWYYVLHNWHPNGYCSVCLCILPQIIQSTPLAQPVYKVSTISPIVGIFCYYIRVGEIPRNFHSNFFSLCVRLNSKWTQHFTERQTGQVLIRLFSITSKQIVLLFFYMVIKLQP